MTFYKGLTNFAADSAYTFLEEYFTFFTLCRMFSISLTITALMKNEVYLFENIHLPLSHYWRLQAKLKRHTVSEKPNTFFYMT